MSAESIDPLLAKAQLEERLEGVTSISTCLRVAHTMLNAQEPFTVSLASNEFDAHKKYARKILHVLRGSELAAEQPAIKPAASQPGQPEAAYAPRAALEPVLELYNDEIASVIHESTAIPLGMVKDKANILYTVALVHTEREALSVKPVTAAYLGLLGLAACHGLTERELGLIKRQGR